MSGQLHSLLYPWINSPSYHWMGEEQGTYKKFIFDLVLQKGKGKVVPVLN
jgi:hypothetical protein